MFEGVRLPISFRSLGISGPTAAERNSARDDSLGHLSKEKDLRKVKKLRPGMAL